MNFLAGFFIGAFIAVDVLMLGFLFGYGMRRGWYFAAKKEKE